MACLFGNRPLSEPILGHCQLLADNELNTDCYALWFSQQGKEVFTEKKLLVMKHHYDDKAVYLLMIGFALYLIGPHIDV